MYSVADLRAGQAIEIDGVPYLVLSAKFGRKSQGKANCVTKIRNLETGAIVSRTFIGAEEVMEADIGYRHVQFLYASAAPGGGSPHNTFTFMDLNSYDQFELPRGVVGPAADYLADGAELDVLLFSNRPIAVKLPATVDLRVAGTSPGVRGDTAHGGTKPATLETGLTAQVPLFVNEGDTVRVNTESGEYVERVKIEN